MQDASKAQYNTPTPMPSVGTPVRTHSTTPQGDTSLPMTGFVLPLIVLLAILCFIVGSFLRKISRART